MKELKKPLYLIGMPGSGKSTVGRLLGRELDVPVLDLDDILEHRLGVVLAKYIANVGEETFRGLESDLLRETSSESAVICTGGGIVTHSENRSLMRDKGLVVYLHADLPILLERLRGEPRKRPLLGDNELSKSLMELYKQRARDYEETAHKRIECQGRAPESIVKEMLAWIEEEGVQDDAAH
jgi:shikimate kinase